MINLSRRAINGLTKWAYTSPALNSIKPVIRSFVTEGGPPLQGVLRNRTFAEFTSSAGHTFPLIEGLRDRLKPEWRQVLAPALFDIPDDGTLSATLQRARKSVDHTIAMLRAYGFHVSDSYVLEAGCYDGARSMALIERGAAHVTASDILRFHPRPYPHPGRIETQEEHIAHLRGRLSRVAFGSAGQAKARRLVFAEDDITRSSLPTEDFDLICSWEVLEHIKDPLAGMTEMHRLLKPGGLAFHEYNPFFALDGGHSPCTLDFPWGHAILDIADFDRYLREFRPKEVEIAKGYYENSLNRMTMAELSLYAQKAGFETLCIMPWPRETHSAIITEQTLRLVRAGYPTATFADLASPVVWALFRKPSQG